MRRLRGALLVVLGAVLGLSVAIFIFDNRDPIQLKFLQWQLDAPIEAWALALVSALAGALVPRLLLWGVFWDRYKERRQLRRRLQQLEQEVVRLRNMPLGQLGAPEVNRASRSASPRAAPAAAAPSRRAGERAEGDPYERFLDDGEGFDAVEAETYAQRPELLPSEDGDPYEAAFDKEEMVVADLEDAQIYVSVRDSGASRGKGT